MRKPDPPRIYEAKRAGLRARMVSTRRVREVDVDRLLDGWDAEAAGRGLERADGRYWSDGEAWMRDRVA
jgi:hypothetical protein